MKKINLKGATWDSIFLTAVKFVTTITAILQTKILSIGLSLTDYGTYSQANIVVSICTSLLLLGLGDAINFYYNDASNDNTKERKIKIVNTIFLIETIAGIILSLTVVLGRGLIANYFSNAALKVVISIVAIKPMLDNMISFYQVLFVSTGKAKLIAFRNFVVSIIKLITAIVAVYIFKNIFFIFASLIVLDVLQLLLFAFFFSKENFKISLLKGDISFFKPIMQYGLPMGVFALTNTLTRDIDKLVIGYMSNTETIAIYANCSKMLPFDIIAVSFATVLIPYIMKYVSQGEKDKSVLLFKNYLKVGYYSVWIFGVAVLIVAKQAIMFLYSSDYLQGEMVFILYVIDSMMKFASMHLIMTARGKAKMLMLFSLISLGANMVLNILLYYLLGTVGPAIATLIVTAGYTIAILHRSIIILDSRWHEVFDFKDVITFILGLGVTGGVFYTINRFLVNKGLNIYASMVINMVCFGLANLLINRKKIKMVLKEINTLKL